MFAAVDAPGQQCRLQTDTVTPTSLTKLCQSLSLLLAGSIFSRSVTVFGDMSGPKQGAGSLTARSPVNYVVASTLPSP